MIETWTPVIGYEKLYEVSNLGRIRGIKRGKILRQINRNYYKVYLSKNGIPKLYTVHRLVAKAFIPNPDDKKQVNHIDGNKLNNSITNLEWNTPSENIRHAVRTGLSKYKKTKIFMFDKSGSFLKSYDSISGCAKETGLNAKSIQNAAYRNVLLYSFRFSFTPELVLPKHNVRRQVALINKNNTVIKVYESAQEAAKELGLKRGDHIAKVCRGLYKSYKGNLFKYV